MFQRTWEALKDESKVVLLVGAGFAVSLLVGMVTARWGPAWLTSWAVVDPSRNEHIEMVFGRFRDGVREGQLGALASAALVLFAINLFALIAWTVACAFIVPLASLFFGAWAVGIDLPGLHGSSFLSVFLLLIVVGVEWVTIVLSAAAGTSIGLATICPARVGCSSRWPAFKRASTQAMNLYVVILAILAIQTVVEILYVRQVLLMGGTGVPLAPY